MARLTLTLHAAFLHKMRRDALWSVLNPDEGKAERPWVAHLMGLDDRYGLAREFLRGEYASYNRRSGRTRDVVYDLAPGLYEINAPTAYDKADRYFAIVDPDGALRRVSKGEILVRLVAIPTAAELAALLTDEDHERH